MPKRSDDPSYDRKPLSNYEGFKRLDKSLEKIDAKESARSKICDVCGRRMRAWRLVPATFGKTLGPTRAGVFRGALTGKFVLVCDAGPDGCAETLIRAGVAKEGVEENAAIERVKNLGLILS